MFGLFKRKTKSELEDVVPVKTEAEMVYVLETHVPNGNRYIHTYLDADTALQAQENVRATNPKANSYIMRCKVEKEPVATDYVK